MPLPVSIHASSREDATQHGNTFMNSAEFQSTRPRGRTRPGKTSPPICPISFNPRVLAGGRDGSLGIPLQSCKFQSTRPRGRTRPRLDVAFLIFLVSIHASSREDATGSSVTIDGDNNVSIHASSREDATTRYQSYLHIRMFQSTRPRGRTRQLNDTLQAYMEVSIHASSREDATGFRLMISASSAVSIHASSREDATRWLWKSMKSAGFQSTRPRGRTRQPLVGG